MLSGQAVGGPTAGMQADLDRLIRAAQSRTASWPSQPPPPVPEVAVVVRHGRAIVPLLMALLSDDPNAERNSRQWRVQQQAALALIRIYDLSGPCGRAYCDGDPPERIGNVRDGWRRVIAADTAIGTLTAAELLVRFKQEPVFWRQFEVAAALARTGDRGAVADLTAWLTHDDRHIRGNAAFVVGRLGDPRGFETLAQILADRSARSTGQGIPGGRWNLQAQIRSDRYYAAHLVGDLQDRRGVDLLLPLLDDPDVDATVPWSLARIGDRRAIAPLIARTATDDPSARVLAIGALERMEAREALPRLRELLEDHRKSTFGNRTTVAEAARHAIAVISHLR